MVAGQANFFLENGVTFSFTLYWQNPDGSPINLTGYTALMTVYNPNTHISYTGTQITIMPLLGEIQLTISSIDTAALADGTTYFYHLDLTSGSVVTRLLRGKMGTAI